MRAFTRISDEPINLHCGIYTPGVVVVLDPTLLKATSVAEGLAEDGVLVINTRDGPVGLRKQLNLNGQKLWTVRATDIATEILGRPITNTAMLGAVARASGMVDLKSLENAVRERFPDKLAEKNIAVVRKAYKEAISG